MRQKPRQLQFLRCQVTQRDPRALQKVVVIQITFFPQFRVATININIRKELPEYFFCTIREIAVGIIILLQEKGFKFWGRNFACNKTRYRDLVRIQETIRSDTFTSRDHRSTGGNDLLSVTLLKP